MATTAKPASPAKSSSDPPRVTVIGPTIGVNLRVTGNCNQGGRKYMEDMFSVAYQQNTNGSDLEYAFFGIFDGHGGHYAASYAKEHLMRNIIKKPDFWLEDDNRIVQAIEDGFIETHHAMWKNIDKWPKTVSGLPSTSGTTASIAFLRHSKAYIGHVGDSAIVIGKQKVEGAAGRDSPWVGRSLTVDHKPENPKEQARIEAAGGQVVTKSGVPRVVWQRPNPSHHGPLTRSTPIDNIPFLAVARSLGDLWSYNSDTEEFIVSPMPDVTIHKFDAETDRCLILGTDGLFNMLTAQAAVEIVEKAERNNQDAYAGKGGAQWVNPAKYLVDHAIAKWATARMRADNTSALVMLLDPLGQTIISQATVLGPAKGQGIKNGEPNERTLSPNHVYIHTWPPNRTGGPSKNTPEVGFECSKEPKEDLEKKIPEPTTGASVADRWRKNALRNLRKRRSSEESIVKPVKRNRSVCSDSCPEENRPTDPVTLRPRRTRSEEPIRTEVRTETDAENVDAVDAPMKLRSSTAFKTLRSRNVLQTPTHHAETPDEPRAKRLKK